MAKTINYSYETLKTFCVDAFQKFGFSSEQAEIITESLLLADLYGIESHGIQRLVRYHTCIKRGMIHIDATPEVVFETPVSAVIDGHEGMGQLISHKAINLAIEKAKNCGMAMVVVRNSNHYGIAGYYAKMAAEQGFIGISSTNTEAICVPTYGKKAMLGTNPIAVAAPAEPYMFLFDASTSVVTRGKLEVCNKLDKPLYENWANNNEGVVSTDAAEVLTCIKNRTCGGILPLGGSEEATGSHKGYGYGMLVEYMTGILSMGLTSNKTGNNNHGGICHSFIVIDPNIFGSAEDIKKHFSEYLEELRNSPKALGQDKIYTHGEKEVAAYADRMKNGINVNVNTVAEMRDCAQYLGMDVVKYLGEEALDIKGKESLY